MRRRFHAILCRGGRPSSDVLSLHGTGPPQLPAVLPPISLACHQFPVSPPWATLASAIRTGQLLIHRVLPSFPYHSRGYGFVQHVFVQHVQSRSTSPGRDKGWFECCIRCVCPRALSEPGLPNTDSVSTHRPSSASVEQRRSRWPASALRPNYTVMDTFVIISSLSSPTDSLPRHILTSRACPSRGRRVGPRSGYPEETRRRSCYGS